MFGYTSAEVIGRSVGILFPEDKLDELHATLERMRQGELVAEHESIRVRKDGQPIRVAITCSPIRAPSGRGRGGDDCPRHHGAQASGGREHLHRRSRLDTLIVAGL